MIPELVRTLMKDRQTQHASEFRVAILYESALAKMHAENFSRDLATAVCLPIHCGFWPFQPLGLREVRNVAASAAAEANVVVFAAGGEKPLPTEVEAWIEMWSWLIDRGHPSVVALFENHGRKTAAINTYLRQKAGCKGLNFFPQINSRPTDPIHGMQPGIEGAAHQASVLKNGVASSRRAPINHPQCEAAAITSHVSP